MRSTTLQSRVRYIIILNPIQLGKNMIKVFFVGSECIEKTTTNNSGEVISANKQKYE